MILRKGMSILYALRNFLYLLSWFYLFFFSPFSFSCKNSAIQPLIVHSGKKQGGPHVFSSLWTPPGLKMLVSFCSSSFLLKPLSTTEMKREAGWGRQREGVCSPQLSGEDRTAFSCDSCALSSERCQFPERHLEMRQDLTQYSEDTLTHSWENTFLEVPRCTPADLQRHAQDWRLTSPMLVL